jgi:hypothetical protein
MAYDAALVARRGLGPDEIRLIEPTFAAAVRWAYFVEKISPDVADLRRLDHDPPDALAGAARTEFMAARSQARKQYRVEMALLYPEDDVSDG